MQQELRAAIRSILATPRWAIVGTSLALATTVVDSVEAAELPVVCASGACGVGRDFNTGHASTVQVGNTLTINQTVDRALLNWESFNVSADGRVVFNQPNANSIALNRIYQESPSRIFGTVEANGQIYLVNPNGFVFGRTAKINASGILASTLDISDDTFARGLLAPELIQNSDPALQSDGRVNVLRRDGTTLTDVNGEPVEVRLVVEEGAKIESRGSGGRVLLASREIDNAGTISSPDGQVILAAGDSVYLQASANADLRGLLVEVDAGGEAWNRMTGDISAARGNVTVVGLAVNQSGRISASTTVAANGSIKLLARDTASFVVNGDNTTLGAGQNGGRLEIGSTSRIEVLPELDDDTTGVDEQRQAPSQIAMSGREVILRSGSQIVAPAGELTVTAASNPSSTVSYDASARIRVESGVQIDLSGSDVTLPMSRNLVTVELRANELRDSPEQRNGALRGQTIVVDARIGTPLADVSGALAAVPKSIAERTSHGGTAVFNSEGDVAISEGARIDVSGGVTTFLEGPVGTSQLIGADGKLYDIGEADPSRTYVGVLNPMFRRADDRWGYIDLIAAPGINRIEPGYLAGSDAGTVQFAAPSIVMNGTLTANTLIGPYQRLPGQRPLGGQLIIGLPEGVNEAVVEDYRAPSVAFSNHPAVIAVGNDAPLPPQQTLLLPTEYLNRGFTRTAIYSNGTITIPADTPLNLAAGSTLNLTGQRVDVLADVASIGGTIAATSVLTAGIGVAAIERAGVSVADGVTLDVRGNWTNDALSALTDPFGRPSTSVLADGGSIALITRADNAELVLGDQVQMLADAGAWLQRDGTLQGGDGGSIKIEAAGLSNAFEIGDAVTVQAFGVPGGRGGRFSLMAPRIEVNSAAAWSRAQRLDPLPPPDPDPSDPPDPIEPLLEYLSIGSSLFTDHGFSSIALTAEGTVDRDVDPDGLRIAEGTQIQARASVLQMNQSSADAASGVNIANLATVTLPVESARQAMSLSFSVDPSGDRSPDRIGLLTMQSGASINADAGSSIAFSSVGGIDADGVITARGGSIAMTIANPDLGNDLGYRPEIGLHLGANARLDVSGTSVYEPVGDGLLSGTIYDGGKVTLQANRGYVIADEGALIDVSGTSAALDRIVSADGATTRDIIGSNAGSLTLIAPEAIAFNGTLRAHAGVGDTGTATGGELIMRLSRSRGHQPGPNEVRDTYPTNPRVLRVTSEGIAIGGGAPPSGLAVLRQDVIDDSGIDALTLEADGRIEFDDVSLSMNRRIVLDTPEILARDGADVSLSAPYLALGNTLLRSAPTPTTGTGSFNFQGTFIEAIGAVSLSGATTATLASSGDLRLREIQEGSARAGHLQTAGDLTLRATQIYPSTLTAYSLSALGDESTLRIESAGSPASTPLTAGGSLTLNAANIEQHGVLRAPFGSIDFNATQSITLGAGSLTSVSADGAVIPFGRIENGEWVYQSANRVVRTAIPERRIDLDAPTIEQDSSATLDLEGGGDLYAYEWIPGTGGSKDALGFGDDTQTPFGRYAILPSQRGQFAPYDPQETRPYDLQVGDSVYLSGIPGLEAGYYALLPARYALLPGALLIEAVPDATDLQPGTTGTLADGTPVVAGYRTFGSTGLGGTRYSGFAIRTSEQARQLATYEDSFASTFYADRAARADQPRPVLPADAGTLSLLATTSLDMRGIVNLGAAKDGLAGRVEVSAPNLEVVNAISENADTVQIAASVLNRWGAGEVWLGGTQRGGSVDVIADDLRISDGVSIRAEEVVLLANRSVDLAAGATIASNSGGQAAVDPKSLTAADLTFRNDDAGAAILSVSDRNLYSVTRGAGDADVGSINAASGSTLTTGGSLLAHAPASVVLDGDIRARDALWQLGSSTVRFDEATHADGLNIDSTLLARMQEAGSLTLASEGAMEFSYALSLGAGNPLDALVLKAGAFNNLSGGDISFTAGRVTLAGTHTPAAPATVGSGTLSIIATDIDLGETIGVIDPDDPNDPEDSIDLGDRRLALNGFANTSLFAANDIRGLGKTTVNVGGNLHMAAARVTAASGGFTTIDAALGNVDITSTGTASTSIDGILGGALSIKGNNIAHSGTLFLPSGVVSLEAASNLSVASTGVIDVSGQLVTAADRIVGSSGGSVKLASGGALTTDAGSLIDVRGATGANAGRLSMHATGAANVAGTLRAQAGSTGATGGAFDIYAGSLANPSGLVTQLQTAGFTERQAIHVATGDLTLANNQTVTARNIEWTADQGRVQVDGTMRAPSTAQRSAIRLYGANVNIGSTGQLNADANAGVRFGGDIELGSSTGSLSVAQGSVLSARGQQMHGTLRLRAAAVGRDVAIGELAGTIRDVDSVVVEAVRVYNAPATVTATEYNTYRNDIAAYMDNSVPEVPGAGANIRGRLDANGALRLRVEAGVELRRDGDLTLNALNLSPTGSPWRFDDSPIALTVRASGSINVAGTISDGFNTTPVATTLLAGDSATLRFAAGANLASARPDAVVRGAPGSLTLAPNASIRTGTGDVRVAAANDVNFGAGSRIYTGGIQGAPTQGTYSFPDRGGNVSIYAGHDIVGAAVTQSVTDWQPRQGEIDGAVPDFATRLGVNQSRFGWNTATLGGGDLAVVAGNDINDLSAAAADTLVELMPNQLSRFGGGSLSVMAGNDVNSALLYVGRGEAKVLADGSLGATRPPGVAGLSPLGSLLMLGEARGSMAARGDVNLEVSFNPSVASGFGATAAFFTYGDRSALDARSNGGDVILNADGSARLNSYLGSEGGNATRVMPSSLTLMSMANDVKMTGGSVVLYPSNDGQLDLFAARDLLGSSGANIIMADVGRDELPTPLQAFRGSLAVGRLLVPLAASATGRHIDDDQPALITAGRDIIGHDLILAKTTQMTAGRDIVDTNLRAQNLRAGDVTLVQAGRDLTFSPSFVTGQMNVGGPGRFDVITGRNLDLGLSTGLTTSGRLLNASLQSATGADLNVMVGMGRDVDANAFVDKIIATSAELRDSLRKFMVARTGNANLTDEQVVTQFKALDAMAQRPLLLDLFYGELVASGREANSDPTKGFTRGYSAIDALFPGSRAEEGEVNPYEGDLTLELSRIYTLAGGDISIAVPGGLVNVGLANPPSTVGERDQSQLGIVAQGTGSVRIFTNDDVLVNSSRVFSLLGGDIAIWSTVGDIDAGRGSKTAVSVPPPTVLVDSNGQITLDYAGAVAGSGIRTISTDENVKPGDVDLIAPEGVVNAGDAGIGAGGNLNIAAQQVVGLDNIQVGGVSTGVPAETGGLGASLASVSAAASSSSSASTSAVEEDGAPQDAQASLAQTALSWLEVFVVGLGEENCKQDDVDCLKRQPL